MRPQKLNNNDAAIRHQAAISPGKPGDKRAIPILNKLKENEDFKQLASSLLESLDSGGTIKTQSSVEKHRSEHFGIIDVQNKNENYLVQYEKRYVLFNEDMREVINTETIRSFTSATQNDLKKQKHIGYSIEMKLKKGHYQYNVFREGE